PTIGCVCNGSEHRDKATFGWLRGIERLRADLRSFQRRTSSADSFLECVGANRILASSYPWRHWVPHSSPIWKKVPEGHWQSVYASPRQQVTQIWRCVASSPIGLFLPGKRLQN